MSETQNGPPPRPIRGGVFTVGSSMLLLAAIALSLLLMVIGAATRIRGLTLTGAFIFPLSLFTGGLFWSEELLPVRITLLALGGLFVIAAVSGRLIF